MKDYADFMNRLHEQYPAAERLMVVQDNLNTHKAGSIRTKPGSFYQSFEAEKARTLTERFEFHFTPVKASGLNMAELDLSAISRQALHRRIASQSQLEHWVAVIIKGSCMRIVFSSKAKEIKIKTDNQVMHLD